MGWDLSFLVRFPEAPYSRQKHSFAMWHASCYRIKKRLLMLSVAFCPQFTPASHTVQVCDDMSTWHQHHLHSLGAREAYKAYNASSCLKIKRKGERLCMASGVITQVTQPTQACYQSLFALPIACRIPLDDCQLHVNGTAQSPRAGITSPLQCGCSVWPTQSQISRGQYPSGHTPK